MSKEIIINPNTKYLKKINVSYSNVDDIDTIRTKVASILNIPYSYIYLNQNNTTIQEQPVELKIPFKKITKKIALTDIAQMNISFTTLESIILENKKKSFESIYEIIKNNLILYQTEDKYYICVLFYYYFGKPLNTDFISKSSSPKYMQYAGEIFEFISYVEKSPFFGTLISFEQEYEQFVIKLKSDIEATRVKNKSINEIANMILDNKKNANKVKKELSKERIKFVNSKVILHNINKDEMEIFENIRMSRDIPYASINGFSKVLKSFLPPDDFLIHQDTKLTLFVFNKKYETLSNVLNTNSYSLIKIQKIKDTLEILIDSKVEGIDQNTEVREETIIERIINSLNMEGEIPSIECDIVPQYYKGEFHLQFYSISRLVSHDIIMINEFISKLFAINEQFTTINKKGGVSIVYLPSDNENKNEITTCSLSNGIVSSANKRFIKGTTMRLGDNFVGISFKTKNNYTLSILKECLCHFFSIYKKLEEEVKEEYKAIDCEYKSDIKEIDRIEKLDKKKVNKKDLKLRDYLPDVFVSNYPATCGKQPYIIENEEEALKKIEEGEDLFKYPLRNEFDQYYYSCANHEAEGFIYPGLKKTNLSENLLPCCFTTDQTENSLRELYETDRLDEEEKKKTKGFKIYKTSKIMPVGGFGFLASNVEKLFNIIDPGNTYLRAGVSLGINSCIEAIVRSMEDEEELSKMSKNKLSRYLDKYRQDLKSHILKGAGSQNSYLYSTYNLKDILKQDKFLDIRLFHDALQELFKCHIIIFQINKEHPEGEMIAPYYINNLYSLKQKREYRYTVILYETMGSRIDNIHYPHYEFVCKYKTQKNKEKITSIYSQDDIISTSLSKIFDDIFIKFSSQMATSVLKNPFETKIMSQKADSFGKIRVVSFIGGVNIFLQPIDSIPTSSIEKNMRFAELIPVSYEKAIEFLKKEDIDNFTFSLVQGMAVGILANKNDVRFYIPIIPTDDYEFINTTIQSKAPSFMVKEDILSTLAKREKSARNLMALTMYLFSSYINSNKKSISDKDLLETVLEFKKDKIFLDKSIGEEDYFKIERKFYNNGFIKNSKLLINSLKLIKKLVYNLFVKTRQNSDYMKNYSSLEYIPDYYQDDRDFKKDEGALFFNSTDSLKRWKKAMNQIKDSKVYSLIEEEFINSLEKYNISLFSNNSITTNNNLYLATKASSIYSACAFFDILETNNKADVILAKSEVYDNRKILNTFKGKMIYINDQDANDIIIKKYGNKDTIIIIFKYENKNYIICLFKYKWSGL